MLLTRSVRALTGHMYNQQNLTAALRMVAMVVQAYVLRALLGPPCAPHVYVPVHVVKVILCHA